MNLKLMHPQEIEVHYILPAIRRELALEMKKLGLDQKTISKHLGVTEAAVSQYVRAKRASKIKFNKQIYSMIASSASKIKDSRSMIAVTQKILREVHKCGLTCKIHKQISDLPHDCKACKENNY